MMIIDTKDNGLNWISKRECGPFLTKRMKEGVNLKILLINKLGHFNHYLLAGRPVCTVFIAMESFLP